MHETNKEKADKLRDAIKGRMHKMIVEDEKHFKRNNAKITINKMDTSQNSPYGDDIRKASLINLWWINKIIHIFIAGVLMLIWEIYNDEVVLYALEETLSDKTGNVFLAAMVMVGILIPAGLICASIYGAIELHLRKKRLTKLYNANDLKKKK